MKCTTVVFPFDQFGSAGTGAGAQLLGDAIREIIEDTNDETAATRADAYRGKLVVRETPFEAMAQVAAWRATGRKLAKQHLATGDFLLWLAGNHLGVLPVLEELGPETLVIQFDAHLDVHHFHDTTKELSHGNFLRHMDGPLPRIVNVGHRDLLLTKNEIDRWFEAVIPAEELVGGMETAARTLRKLARSAPRVWIDVDCDALDPSVLPAVQHPQPFGLSAAAFLTLAQAVCGKNLAGVSISEFDPGRDVRDTSLNLLGWFLEWLIVRRME